MRKKSSCQKTFRKKSFGFHQYWIIYFTEKIKGVEEKDYVTFIKAKSYCLAKNILLEKVKEDYLNKKLLPLKTAFTKNESRSVKNEIKLGSVRGYMLHENYKNSLTGDKLSIEDWSDAREASFPNLKNFLFKKEIPRPEGYTNKFNKTNYEQLKKIGFKKGKENWSHKNRKGTYLPVDQRKGMIFKGKWVKWDKEEMKKSKNQIIDALTLNNNNRFKTAEYLNIGRNSLYKIMTRIESLDWWNENYPYTRPTPPILPTEVRSQLQKNAMKVRMSNGEIPFSSLSSEQKQKRTDNRLKAIKKSSSIYRKSLIPIITEALKCNDNIRRKAASSLNVKEGTFRKWLRMTENYVNWTKDYPSPHNK